ncbi:hypothetical protein I6G53_03945 [Serratia plymuthica]|nr:hypothetical protein I6G53_03945 [Serratia plymuthica]
MQQRVADREFRSDLYYRLNVCPILIPAEFAVRRDRTGFLRRIVRPPYAVGDGASR